MVYELKKHFDKKFIELQKSMDVNKNTLESFKSGIKVDLQKLEDKIGNKIKALESDKKSLQHQIQQWQNKIKKPSNAMISWNRMVIGSPFRLIVFLNRITKKLKTSLKLVKMLRCKKDISELEMPEAVIETAHRIADDDLDKKHRKYVSL